MVMSRKINYLTEPKEAGVVDRDSCRMVLTVGKNCGSAVTELFFGIHRDFFA